MLRVHKEPVSLFDRSGARLEGGEPIRITFPDLPVPCARLLSVGRPRISRRIGSGSAPKERSGLMCNSPVMALVIASGRVSRR